MIFEKDIQRLEEEAEVILAKEKIAPEKSSKPKTLYLVKRFYDGIYLLKLGNKEVFRCRILRTAIVRFNKLVNERKEFYFCGVSPLDVSVDCFVKDTTTARIMREEGESVFKVSWLDNDIESIKIEKL